jgi:predicted nucleic acid-binding protein
VTLVVDASVAALWTLAQRGSDKAAALQGQGDLIAPSLIVAEIGNAIWKAVRRGDLPAREARTAVDLALGPLSALVPLEELHERALELSILIEHAIYDCFYLALAERERAPLVCVDGPLLAKTKTLKQVEIRTL